MTSDELSEMFARELSEMLARICAYAQEYSATIEFDEPTMRHVSHVVSCFLAQNTKYGNEGVESDIVLGLLMQPRSLKQWRQKFKIIVQSWNNKPLIY